MKSISRLFLFVLTAALLIGITLSGCNKKESDKADKRITEAVSKLKLPQKLNNVTTLTECSYIDKTLTFCLETTADTLAAMNAEARRAVTLDNLRSRLLPQNLVSNLIDAKASVRYIYVCGKDTVQFTFESDDLK